MPIATGGGFRYQMAPARKKIPTRTRPRFRLMSLNLISVCVPGVSRVNGPTKDVSLRIVVGFAVDHHRPGAVRFRKFNQLFVEIFVFVFLLQEQNIKLQPFPADNFLWIPGSIYGYHGKCLMVFKFQAGRNKCCPGAKYHSKSIVIHFSP